MKINNLFFSFPRNQCQRRQWEKAVNRLRYGSKDLMWESKITDVVCSKHFGENDFYYPGRRKRLKKDAIPNVKRSYSTNVALGESATLPRPSRIESEQSENLRLKHQVVEKTKELRNTRKREIRLRRSVGTLMTELQEQKLINADLKSQLDDLKGKILSFVLCSSRCNSL